MLCCASMENVLWSIFPLLGAIQEGNFLDADIGRIKHQIATFSNGWMRFLPLMRIKHPTVLSSKI
ncbi:hypothetical protein LINGRAHAP2_LOCUS7574 [Linum grandiflorum]